MSGMVPLGFMLREGQLPRPLPPVPAPLLLQRHRVLRHQLLIRHQLRQHQQPVHQPVRLFNYESN